MSSPLSETHHKSDDRDAELAHLLEDVIRRQAKGEPVDHEAIKRCHAHLMPELARRLEGIAFLAKGDAAAVESGQTAERPIPPSEKQDAHVDDTLSMTPGSRGIGPDSRNDPQNFPVIAGYRMIGVLGQGGMGIVYRAMQEKLDRVVALKFLPSLLASANPSAVSRFRREAKAAARLHHTNIIPVHDYGVVKEGYYYAMELVEGRPVDELVIDLSKAGAATMSPPRLSQVLTQIVSGSGAEQAESDFGSGSSITARTPLGGTASTGHKYVYYRQLALWIADVAEALHYAHGQGIVHRDIKPSNLVLSRDNRIMVADFGPAKTEGDASVTVTGHLLGTIRYLSPEQAMAKRILVDHRTDIYSLGATLYELLCFQPAFPGEGEARLLAAIVTKDPIPPRKIEPHVPSELEVICQKCMEKSADKRYATALDLAHGLRRFISDLPIVAKPPGTARRMAKFLRRRATVAIVTALVLAVAMPPLLWLLSRLAENVRDE